MERPPISSYLNNPSREDDFPVLNPSRSATGTSFQMPQRTVEPEEEVEEAQPEQSSFLVKMKDRVVGAAKSIGGDLLGTAKMIGGGVPKAIAGPALGQFVPDLTEMGPFKKGFDKAESLMKPSNERQAKAKKVTDWATLLAPFFGTAVTKAPGYARALEEVSLRLTSAEKRDLGSKLEKATNYIVEKGITGNPSQRLDKAEVLYEETEDRLQKFFTQEAKDVKVPRELYIARLEALKGKYGDDRDSLAINNQIDEAITTIKKNYATSPMIPIENFNKWKRSVMKDAFSKAGLKVRDDVEFAIGNEANEMLKEATKHLSIDGKTFSEFNDEYSALINARKLLYKAEDRDQLSMPGKIISTILGTGIGGGVSGGIGFAAGGPLGASITGPIGASAGVYLGTKVAPAIAGTAVRSRLGQVYNSDLIKSLDPAARKLLGFSLLYPSRLKETFGSDDEELTSLPIEEEQQDTPVRKEGRPSLESYLQ